MKNKSKISLCSCIICFAALVFGGCGRVNESIPETKEDKITITVFDKNAYNKTFDDDVAMAIMEKTGINIEVVDVSDDYEEKLNLMLSTKTYPDIVLMGQGEILSRYIEAGALLDLDELIEEYAPNVTKMYGDVLDKTKYSDGKNYWLAVPNHLPNQNTWKS